MTKTTFALIGTGIVGERIINQALANDHCEIVGIYDENKDRLQQIAQKYALHAVENLQQLFDLRPDWVYIGTPPVSHAPLAKLIAEQGLNVLSEKPLAHDAVDGEKMVQAVAEANVLHAMHFPMMYSPTVQALKEAIANKELGEVVRIELHTHFAVWPRPWQQTPWIASREQGGFIREVFPHYLQLTNHLFGDLEIIAHDTIFPADETLCETGVAALARTEAGIPVVLNGLANIGQQELLQFHVFGTEKVMTIRNWSELWVSEHGQPAVQMQLTTERASLLQACHEKVKGHDALTITFDEGLKVQRWIDQLLK